MRNQLSHERRADGQEAEDGVIDVRPDGLRLVLILTVGPIRQSYALISRLSSTTVTCFIRQIVTTQSLMNYTDCVLTVDGVLTPVSLGLLAHRSGWFAEVFRDTKDPAKLSELAQEAWTNVRAMAGNPSNLLFSTFYEAIVTGRADESLLHRAGNCLDVVLEYFDATQVSYGWILIEEMVYDSSADYPLQIYHALSRKHVTAEQLVQLQLLSGSRQHPKLLNVDGWNIIKPLLTLATVKQFQRVCSPALENDASLEAVMNFSHTHGRVNQIMRIWHMSEL